MHGALGLILAALLAPTAEMAAADIAAAALQRNAFGVAAGRAEITLQTVRPGGGGRRRELQVLTRRDGPLLQTVVRLTAPPEVAGTAFLSSSGGPAASAQYLYLPALAKTKRIGARQRDEPFLDTELTFGDVQAEPLLAAAWRREPDATLGGVPCFVIAAALPPGPDPTRAQARMWVHKEALLPLQVEFGPAAGPPAKRLQVRRLERRDSGWTVVDTVIHNLATGGRTTVHLGALQPDAGLDPALFTPAALAGP